MVRSLVHRPLFSNSEPCLFSTLSPSLMRLTIEDDEQKSLSSHHELESLETSQSTVRAHLLSRALLSPPPPATSSHSYFHRSSPQTSYFTSGIESAMKQRLDEDDEPIPFIDDNLSVAYSRKSSACWSDRTSLSSRLGFAWKFNLRRSASHIRPPSSHDQSVSKKSRRHQPHRTVRYPLSASQQHQSNDEL